jgi:hypothetical protein
MRDERAESCWSDNWQEKNMPQCYFVHHKRHMGWFRIEPKPVNISATEAESTYSNVAQSDLNCVSPLYNRTPTTLVTSKNNNIYNNSRRRPLPACAQDGGGDKLFEDIISRK